MSDPLIDSTDLGTYLNDASIQADRADLMISQAQALCESILSPLPAIASVVVMRVAARGYTTAAQARGNAQMVAAGSPFQTSSGGGIYLTRYDKADLRRIAGSGGAFSIDMLPSDYTASVPWWGDGSETESLTDFDPIT